MTRNSLFLFIFFLLASCQVKNGPSGSGGGLITPPTNNYTTTISGTTNKIADNIDSSTITINVMDSGVPVVGVIPTYTVSGSNNFISPCSATDTSGNSSCSLKSTKAETKILTVSSPHVSIASSVTFIPGTAGAASTINSAGPAAADGTTLMTINIVMKDAYGNFVTGVIPTFDATDPGNTNVYGACSSSTATGASTCTIKSLRAGIKTLRLTSPVTVSGGPAFFLSGPAVAVNSTIVGTTPHSADGIDASTVTVTLKDVNMNPVLGVVPTFSGSGTSNTYTACTTTDITGISTCKWKTTVPGVKTISLLTPVVKAGNAVTFNSVIGAVSAANSNITGSSPVIANGVATSTITVTLRDASNNGVSGLTPTFAATDTGTTNTYGACSTTNVSGVATCTLASTVAETKTLAITSPVLKPDGNTVFIPGPASAVTTTITGTTPVVADGTAASTISITVRDAFNNPIPGSTPTFSATDTGFQNIYGACSVGNATGVSTCTLKSSFAEVKTLQLLSPVVATGGNVTFVSGIAVAANSSIIGTTPVIADGTATSTITIILKDAGNNPVVGQTPTFGATDTGSTNVYGVCSATDATGTSNCTLKSLTAETKTLAIATPVVKAGSNVVFTPAGASVANSTITGSSPVVADGVATSTVTITLKDSANNPVVGQTPTFSATNTGTTNTYGACSATNASGISTCTLSSTKAETKILSIATPIVKAGGSVVFTPGTPGAANSTISGTTPVVADGTATSTVTVTLKDAFSNVVPGLTPTFGATDTGSTNAYSVCSVGDASGVSTCTLSSTVAEVKTLAIATPVVKAGGTVTFTAGAPVAANSSITGTTPVVADGTANSTITVLLKDVNNNPVSGIIPTFGATGSSNTYGTCSATDATGSSSCTLSSTVAESKTLAIATPVVKTGSVVVFTSAGASIANSSISGTTPVVADGSATSSVTITLKDANNNAIVGTTPAFSATDTGTTNTYGSCSATDASGISTCTLSSLTAEVKTLAITSPIAKAGSNVTFTSGPAVAANSSITGTTPVVANGSSTSSVTIILKDLNNNPVAGQTPTFGATDTGSTNSYGACSATDATGTSTCTLSSTVAESKTLAIATPVMKAGASVVFVSGTAVAANSSITGTSPVVADGSATSTVTITLKDVNNNPVAGQTPTFGATDTGSTNSYGTCSATDATGTSTCTLSSSTAETKTLAIATPVVKAGGNVVFTAASASVANSTITGTTPVVADGSATSTVTITLKDGSNNPVSGITPAFSATNTGTTNNYGACSATDASGISTCTLSSLKAEVKTLTITSPITKAGGTVSFTAGSAVAANSSITGTTPVLADGTATSTVTIVLKDLNNNPVNGQTPTFGATDTGSTNAYGSCSATDATGISTCTLSSTVAETKTLSIATPVVKAGGTVMFLAGTPVAANSSITGTTPVVADGSATSTVTITLKDVNNNPVAGQSPTFSATDSGSGNSYSICTFTDSSGVSTCTLSSTYAETKTLSIVTPVTKAGSNVVFTSAGASVANSSITGTSPVIADGSAISTVTITLKDGNNNSVVGITPAFSATDTGTTNSYGTCSATNASGISTCTVSSLNAEVKTLSITSPITKAGGNVTFTAGSAVAANSSIIGTSPVVADGLANSTVTIVLKDANNNIVSGQTPTFSATDTGTTNAYGTCSATDGSGTATCTLSSLAAETKTLSIVSPVSKAGGTVTFTAGGAVAANSSITGTTPVVADGSATSTVTITLKDFNNNPVPGVLPTFGATDTGSTNTYGICSLTSSSGVSTCSVSSTVAEAKTLTIVSPIVKAGSVITFSPGSPDPSNSTITGTSPVIADGTATSSITITLKDAFNNSVPGQTPTFGATDTGSANAYGSCSATDSSGVSTCTLSSTVAEVKSLAIATPVVKVGGNVTFSSGTAVAANSTITGTSPVAADGSSTSTVTITLKDVNNNPVSGQTPTFSATDSGSANSYGSCTATSSSGISTCTLSSTVAEVKTLSIATPVVKAGGSVTFTPGSAVAANSTITGTSPVVANGVATSNITITLKDASNNPVAGLTPTFGATDTGSGNTYGSCSVTDASGISSCTLSSTVAEFKTLSIATPVIKAGGTVTFNPGAPVAANSSITGTSPVVADGVATSTVTITLKDANNNAIAGQTPTFSATDTSSGNTYGACSATSSSGISTCTLSSNVAEVKTLSIATPVVKAGGTVTFTAGTPVAANSSITGTSPIVADGTATSTITVTLKDAANNPVAGQTPTFGATNTGTGNTYGTCSATDASGISTCTLSSTVAEVKTLSIATPVIKAGGTVTFTAGSPVAANSSITGTSPVAADGSATSTVTITLKDVNNNPVAGQTPTFSATDSSSGNSYGSCSVTDSSGIATCSFTSTVAEVKTLSIATPVVKAGGTVTFTPGSPVAANSTITGTSPVSADGSATSTVTITLKDVNNNPVAGQTPTFTATNTGSGNTYGSCSATNASGVSTCTLASTIAEVKTLSIATPVAKAGGTVTFTAGSAVAANSTITGTSPVVADGTATSTVTITLKDASNNPVAGQTPTFGATNTGSGNTYGTCSATNASGISTCTLSSTVAEVKTLSIATPVVKAGGTVTFTAGSAVAANSTISGTSPVVADGIATSTVTITLKDASNNPVAGQTPTFGATNTGSGNTYGTCSATNASGISTCTLSSTVAEVKTLSIATPVVKAGGTVTFTAGSPVAANSTITGTSPVVADGTTTSTVTITLKDAGNNPVAGQTPTFTATNTGATNTYGICSATNASGISTCTLSSNTAEVKTLSIATPVVKAGGTVTFTAGSPVAANSTITGTSPVVADGTTTSTVTITLKDASNNPVAGQTPTFTATNTGTTNNYGTCSASNASGVSTCTLASSTAEVKTLSIATPVVKAGGTVTFTAGSAVAVNSTITGTSPVVADGTATSTVTITLKDGGNNPVAGQTPTFGATDTGTTNTYGTCSASNASGVSTCTLASLKAEVKTLSIATPVVKAGGTVTFSAGAAVAANSTITGTGPVLADGTATSTVTINLKDANNNPVSGSTPTFSATNTGATNVYGTCSATDASGASTCTLKSGTTEVKTLAIATPVVKTGGTVTFTAGTPIAANSSITGTSPVVADGTATSTVNITLKDASNNPVAGQTPTFSATNTGTGNTYGTCSASDASGISTCTLSSTVAETKTLAIATPVAKTGGTVTFTAGAPVAANSTIAGTGPVLADGTASSTVTITLKDAGNNPVAGQTPTFGATNTGSTNVYGSCSATNASGVSTCTLTSTKAEVKTLSIATPVVKAGGTVTFTAGSAVAANSTITGTSPVVADATATSTVTITLLDNFSNPVAGQTPTFTATNTGTTNVYGTCSASNATGVSTCTLASGTAEVKTLSIATPFVKAGGTVTFTAGSAVAANSTITGTGPVIANGSATSTVTIVLKDASNNIVSGVTPTFTATNTGSGNTYGSCSATDGTGTSTCTLKSTKAEVKTLSIATPVVKAGGTVTFTAGAAVAANSTITGTGPVTADGVASSTVTITLKDVNNNGVSGTIPTFSATNTGTTNIYGTCSSTDATGASTCTLKSTKAQVKTLSIQTPFIKAGGTVTFVAGSASSVASTITGTTPVAADGVSASFISITIMDAYSNPIAGVTPIFNATNTNSGNTYGACSATDAGGASACTLSSTKAEAKTLQLTSPVAVTGSVVTFSSTGPSATNSTIIATGPVVADGTTDLTVTITLKDSSNNPVPGYTPVFDATDTGAGNTYDPCSMSDASGVSVCTMQSVKAEAKILRITNPVTKTGSTVTFTAGPADDVNSTIAGTGPVVADGVATSTITITLKDAFSNVISGTTPTFSASGTNNTQTACSVTNTSGVSTCTLKSTKAESKIPQILTPVVKAGTGISFIGGTPVAANSTITGTGPVNPDGVQTSTITITLKDVNNNLVPGITPTFTSTGTNNTLGACSLTNASGISTCTLASTTAETKTLSIATPVVKAGGTVVFAVGSPVAANSTIVASGPVVANGVATSTITITLKDSGNGPVPGVVPTFSATGSNNTYTACSTTNASGISTCTMKSTTAENKDVSIATPVIKLGNTVTFTAGVASATTSTITCDASSYLADGSDVCTITVSILDANNNAVVGTTPTISVSGTLNTVSACSATDNMGDSTCTLTSTKAEAKTLSIVTPVAVTNPTTYDFNPNGINIQVPIELVDRALAANTTATTFNRTKTSMNPADYVALTNDFYFEIVAENIGASAGVVYLVNGAGTQITDSAISIPASTSSPRRFRVAFTPSVAADTYRVKTPAVTTAGNVKVHTARIIVQQTNAIQTKVYVPLIHGDVLTPNGTDATAVATSATTSFAQATPANFSWFNRNDANYDTIPATGGWTFEAIMNNSRAAGVATAALHDRNTGLAITGASVSVTGTAMAQTSVTFNSNAANFINGSNVEVRLKSSATNNTVKLMKAGLWIKLKYMRKTDVHWRLLQNRVSTTASAVMPQGRFIYESARWSTPTASFVSYLMYAGGASSAQLYNVGVSDTATAGSLVTTNTATTTYSRISAATTLVDNNRYILNHTWTSGGTSTHGASFLIINAHD